MGFRGPTPIPILTVALEKAEPRDIEQQRDEEENVQAYMRLNSNPNYKPLSGLIPKNLSARMEPWFKGYSVLHAKTRASICRVCLFCSTPGNWAKSRQKMAVELGIPYNHLLYWAQKWPEMWYVIAELSRVEAQAQYDRVLGSTVDAAIYGDSRDRRLYLELFGHIKRNEPTGAEGTILFVNDSVPRPQAPEPKTIEASKVDAGGAPPEEAEASLINDTNKGEGSESDEL